jgi:hypothetical protein
MNRIARMLTALDVIGLVVGIAIAVRHDAITGDSAAVVALAFLVGLVAAAVSWIAQNARRVRVSLAASSTGILAIVGTLRFVDLGTRAVSVSEAAWLACGPLLVVLIFCTARERRPPLSVAVPLGLSVLVVGAAGLMNGSRGRLRAQGISVDPAGPWSRPTLIAHSVLLLGGCAAAVRTTRRPSNTTLSPGTSTPAVLRCAVLWLTIALVERTIYLLPPARLFDQSTGYRAWATVVLVNLPLAAASMIFVAVAFVIIVQPRLRRSPTGALLIDADDPGNSLVRDLSSWVGDPSLRVAFVGAAGQLVDPNGRPFRPRQNAATTDFTRGGQPFAIIEHDATLVDDDLVLLAGTLAGGALDANAALATTKARVVEQRRLAGRLVLAEAATRQQLLDDLERGPLRRIDAVAAGLRMQSSNPDDLVGELRRATVEVRELSHGLSPAELIDGGLASVLENSEGVPQRRLPAAVELTAWLLARHEPGARFDDRSVELLVRLSSPVTDQSLLDRVEALGGDVSGTVVRLPLVEGS